MPYFTQADLEDALGKAIVASVFDDDGDGVPDKRPLDACLAYGTAECDSFIAGIYDITIPVVSVPDALKFAALDFGCAYATRRRPDLVRAMGEEPWTTFRDNAVEKMKRFASSLQRLPRATGTPANVGAEVVSGDPEAPDLPSPPRLWQNMGDF